MTDVPLPISVAAWLICLASLLPAVWRMIRRQTRWLDPLLGLISLFVLNRLSFLLLDYDLWSHATAAALALIMAWLATSYQREERRRANAR